MTDRDAITKAVEALKTCISHLDDADDWAAIVEAQEAIATLTALQQEPARVGVKKLEWGRYGEAMGFCSKYAIYEAGAGWNCVKYSFRGEQGKSRIAEGVPEKEAFAIAQADFDSDVLSALEPSPAPVAVNKLEWVELSEKFSGGELVATAYTRCGEYDIVKGSQGRFDVFLRDVQITGSFDKLDEAKAAAQSDFDHRILSALQPSPAGKMMKPPADAAAARKRVKEFEAQLLNAISHWDAFIEMTASRKTLGDEEMIDEERKQIARMRASLGRQE